MYLLFIIILCCYNFFCCTALYNIDLYSRGSRSVYVQFALTTSPGLKWMMRQNHRSATASLVGLQKKLMYKSGNHHDDNPSPFLEEEPDQPCWAPSSPSSYSPSSRLSPMHIPVMTSLGQLWIFSTSRAPTPTVTTPEDQQPHSELLGVSTQ